MSNDFMFSPSGFATLAFTSVPHLARASGVSLRPGPLLVADGGDDYEMNDDMSKTFVRAGDRVMGFLTGAVVLGALWAASSLI